MILTPRQGVGAKFFCGRRASGAKFFLRAKIFRRKNLPDLTWREKMTTLGKSVVKGELTALTSLYGSLEQSQH